jgi:hypothetical protein
MWPSTKCRQLRHMHTQVQYFGTKRSLHILAALFSVRAGTCMCRDVHSSAPGLAVQSILQYQASVRGWSTILRTACASHPMHQSDLPCASHALPMSFELQRAMDALGPRMRHSDDNQRQHSEKHCQLPQQPRMPRPGQTTALFAYQALSCSHLQAVGRIGWTIWHCGRFVTRRAAAHAAREFGNSIVVCTQSSTHSQQQHHERFSYVRGALINRGNSIFHASLRTRAALRVAQIL